MTKNENVNDAVQKEVGELIDSIHQGDKIFLRNQLDMSWAEIGGSADFILAIALWKKRGGGKQDWTFVLNMTDRQIMEELGFDVEAAEAAAANE